VDIPVAGLSELHIQITVAGDGLHYDQAALGNAHFTRNDSGKVSLTEYAPLSAVRFSLAGGKNQYEGDPISIGGQKFDVGICSHAMDHIVYKVSSDFTHFKAQVGVHDRTTREGPKGKKNGSLQFIFTGVSKPEKEGGTSETSDNS
jgi:hypothetical protein